MSDQPTDQAYRLVQGFRAYQMVVAACELKLPDLLAAGPKSVQELAAATATDEPSLRRLLRGLAVWGVVEQQDGDCFAGTAIADSFRSDIPGMRNMTLNLAAEAYVAWGSLLYSVRTGRPAYEHVFGRSRWEDLAEDPEGAARFNAHMVEITTRVAAGFVRAYELDGIATVVDIGGGNGALLAAVLKANPAVKGVLFDLPAGLAGARQYLESAGVADRATLAEGSFFETVPTGDLHMLKSIVHDWDDERAAQILQACRRAMRPSGRLVLVERFLPERIEGSPSSLDAIMLDLHMMVVLGGRERTTDEFRELLAKADLRMTRTIPAAAGFGIFEAVPA
ncbi:MAG TPA: methyltransferase [Candidatus Dormibacteraeota bacterium]